jgi:chemotaxis protein methyltransferase CheR
MQLDPSSTSLTLRLREFEFSDEDFQALRRLVREVTGISLSEQKRELVYGRLARRLRALNLRSFREYRTLLSQDDGRELVQLCNAITTNLTAFFREPHHFEHLRREVAQWGQASKRLRVWSAGCSSGEEPYSIAITVTEALPDIAERDAKILATDLDTNMVSTAQDGIYPAASLDDMPKGRRVRFFERTSRGRESASISVAQPVRRLITFKQLNLIGEWPMKGPFDAIFCRNVMIYFDGPTKANLVKRFVNLLKPGGFLYIGHSETLLEKQSGLHITGPTIYRKSAS